MDIAENCFHLTAPTEQTDGRSDGRADGARQPMNRQAPTPPHHRPPPTPHTPKFLTCCFTQPIMRAAAADPYPLDSVRQTPRARYPRTRGRGVVLFSRLLCKTLGLVVFAPPCNYYLMAVPPPSRRASRHPAGGPGAVALGLSAGSTSANSSRQQASRSGKQIDGRRTNTTCHQIISGHGANSKAALIPRFCTSAVTVI